MKFCPHCGGDISILGIPANKPADVAIKEVNHPEALAKKYDQDAVWRTILADVNSLCGAAPQVDSIVDSTILEIGALRWTDNTLSTIVHIGFDRQIVPVGGVLYRAAILEGRMKLRPESLGVSGYVVEGDKIQMDGDCPVGPVYIAIRDWGEHMARMECFASPVELNPGRNGNPFFMDESMAAFGVRWERAGLGFAVRSLITRLTRESLPSPMVVKVVAR